MLEIPRVLRTYEKINKEPREKRANENEKKADYTFSSMRFRITVLTEVEYLGRAERAFCSFLPVFFGSSSFWLVAYFINSRENFLIARRALMHLGESDAHVVRHINDDDTVKWRTR